MRQQNWRSAPIWWCCGIGRAPGSALIPQIERVPRATHSHSPTLVIQASLVPSGILTARLLGPEGRGYLALAMLVPVVLVMVGTLGLHRP